ncbi:BZ3500_MvSof-1268-A1-R1_Chr5-3g08334 [Microbotryum saponariae]|uniref:BZ3500_MvSof-1268-A1-R1_Chr5-3g08334 protein n=1 Tax=Microbotryum saponariae TaxID=289078 RepID=A0A2X0MK39_9BASI|nr:BZ3500_MvSof-1268-A1-R1_Chr5-3g08334 [Microbotryum saponariae]SDA08442.1 BZ3501_MvSof-1269-A2-R1_Chr5-3g08062 [Microbotryum saponariae]
MASIWTKHGNKELGNVLLRDDNSVCIIDGNDAMLDFDPNSMRDPVWGNSPVFTDGSMVLVLHVSSGSS